jgi:hypothetical protein
VVKIQQQSTTEVIMKSLLLALLLLSPLTSLANDPHIPEPRDPCDTFRDLPGCPGYREPDPTPIRGTYACYVRSSKGKLYGPGAETRSVASAKAAALNACKRTTGSACRIAYCESY